MAYRCGEDVHQRTMFPESVDEYISADHPVRAYSAFVDALDLKELGIELNDQRVGNSEYHPRLMLKLVLYGYSYGIKSSRKLERETHNNVTFMWIVRRLTPDHKTIAEFRRRNKGALKKALRLCAQLCVKLELIEGNVLFVDGSKVRANAGRGKNHTKGWYAERMQEVDKRIEKLLQECERIDEEEKENGSLVKMREELANAETLKATVARALEEFKSEKTRGGKERTVNLTDPESALMRSIQGSHASYNVQSVVDDKNGLIVHVDAVSETSDVNQFARQIEQAEEVLGKKCTTACADAGYADTEELEKIERGGETTVIVPSQRQALHGEEKSFSKHQFRYDEENDCYWCPEGQCLEYEGKQDEGKKLAYRVCDAQICKSCKQYGMCTNNKRGRKIVRLVNEKAKERFEATYKEIASQEIYRRRKMKVEHPFGHIKRNLGVNSFLTRGREGARAEIALGATCFNIVRMITILGGVQQFISKISVT